MIVHNNGYWRRLIRMGKRAPKFGAHLGTTSSVNYDWSCKTIRVTFWRSRPSEKAVQKWAKKGKRPPMAGKRFCHISPGRY